MSFNDRENSRKISFDYFDIKDFSLFDWGRWSVKNYKDQDKKTKLLDECLLTDHDLLEGKDHWAKLPDPFPEWGDAA